MNDEAACFLTYFLRALRAEIFKSLTDCFFLGDEETFFFAFLAGGIEILGLPTLAIGFIGDSLALITGLLPSSSVINF